MGITGESRITTRELGRTGILISPIGLGTGQFAEGKLPSYPNLPQPEADQIVKAALNGGITWFDTAEGYGGGRAERGLAAALNHGGMQPGDVFVATKWTPLGRTAGSIERTIKHRIANLSPFPINLHQIHMPYGSLSSLRAQIRAMARLVKDGKIRSVGVSNFSARSMEVAHQELAKEGIPLASNQLQINLLHRKIETNGVLETARRLGVTLIASVPLRRGLLTGKFHADRKLAARVPRMQKIMGGITRKNLDRTIPLIEGMREIAGAYQATVGQIALVWLIRYYGDTVVAIPGASKARHAEEAAGVLNLALSEGELQRLAHLSALVSG